MKVELNFKLGQKTNNNRIYNIDDFTKEIERLISKKKLFITSKQHNIELIIDDIVGIVNEYDLKEDGSLWFDIKFIEERFKELKNIKASSMVTGLLQKKENIYIVNDFTLHYLFIVQE